MTNSEKEYTFGRNSTGAQGPSLNRLNNGISDITSKSINIPDFGKCSRFTASSRICLKRKTFDECVLITAIIILFPFFLFYKNLNVLTNIAENKQTLF